MVCTGRGRLMATAAIVEAGQLFLWLWALPLEEQPLAHLLLVSGIVGLCALAASMWRRQPEVESPTSPSIAWRSRSA